MPAGISFSHSVNFKTDGRLKNPHNELISSQGLALQNVFYFADVHFVVTAVLVKAFTAIGYKALFL